MGLRLRGGCEGGGGFEVGRGCILWSEDRVEELWDTESDIVPCTV
jgi:hypothetical protein